MQKALLIIGMMGALIAARAQAPDGTKASEKWPLTVDEAVLRLEKDWLSPKDIEWIKRNPQQVVVSQLHLPFGTGVRNAFGLWGKNKALLASCGTQQAEECSSIIFTALWTKLRSETDPLVAKSLDCQFAALDQIDVDTTGWYLMRQGEMLTDLQRQIDRQVGKMPKDCRTPLRVVTFNDPDLKCWVRAEFEEKEKLGRLFEWISFRNAFSVSYNPPNIELHYDKKCAWPERPKYFEPERKK